MKIKTTLVLTTFLLVGLVFQLLNTNVAFGVGPVLGCCTTDGIGSQCVGCPEGEPCTSTSDYCDSQDGLFLKGACRDMGEGAQCVAVAEQEGCCVLENGACENLGASDGCFIREGSPGEIFVGGVSCSLVPQCTPTRNIPTMSNWGLVALAAVIILVGVWGITRKKAQA